VAYRNAIIGSHLRCFGRYQRLYNPWHYVPLLERKPGALRNGKPFKDFVLPAAMEKIRSQLKQYSDGDKRFIHILLLVAPHGLEVVERACTQALSQGLRHDIGVLRCLQPPIETLFSDPAVIRLSQCPTEDFQPYNYSYLSTSDLAREVCYAK
jgi:hypothetical protein